MLGSAHGFSYPVHLPVKLSYKYALYPARMQRAITSTIARAPPALQSGILLAIDTAR